MIRLYIADDHTMFAEGLESILAQEKDIQILGIARNGKYLLSLLQDEQPDIVLLDISMPEMDGMEAAAQVLDKFPAVKIMMLTMHNSFDYILPLIRKGVHGYVLKNTGKNELVQAIRTLHEKGTYYSDDIAARLIHHLKENPQQSIKLSSRELEILQLVFEGFSTQEISEKLFISVRTVETHRSNLLSKTSAKNTAQLILYALKNGLVKKQD